MVKMSLFSRIKKIFKNEMSGRIDRLFLLAVCLITAYGTIMVFSAGTAYAAARYGDSMYFIKMYYG